jgi:hypothetical protein
VFDVNEALAFIADEPAFWIRAKDGGATERQRL